MSPIIRNGKEIVSDKELMKAIKKYFEETPKEVIQKNLKDRAKKLKEKSNG